MGKQGMAAGIAHPALQQQILENTLIYYGLPCGSAKAAKDSDKGQAHHCVLASSCEKPVYVKRGEALCAQHRITLIKLDDSKRLGEWVCLCRIDQGGTYCNVVDCSCIVVKDYGKASQAKNIIEEFPELRTQRW
ncbi:small ribosomal subunit protein eS12-like [Rattus norvegicus]|nr:40S ribosomal protein S12-like [Rattus norvegicus]